MGRGGTEVVGGQTLSFWTQPGIYTVIDKANPVIMDSSTYGLPVNSRLGYKETINYATRISNDGIYLHELADTIWAQGNTNVSHGCLNLSPDNARWFYDFSVPGDVVEVRGTGGAPLELWQNGDWSLPGAVAGRQRPGLTRRPGRSCPSQEQLVRSGCGWGFRDRPDPVTVKGAGSDTSPAVHPPSRTGARPPRRGELSPPGSAPARSPGGAPSMVYLRSVIDSRSICGLPCRRPRSSTRPIPTKAVSPSRSTNPSAARSCSG